MASGISTRSYAKAQRALAEGVVLYEGGKRNCQQGWWSRLGPGNLPSLQEVYVSVLCEGASKEETEQAKAALTRAAEIHPNHPSHDIDIFCCLI